MWSLDVNGTECVARVAHSPSPPPPPTYHPIPHHTVPCRPPHTIPHHPPHFTQVLSRALRRGGFSSEPTRPCPFLRSLPLEACEPLFFLQASRARQLDLGVGLVTLVEITRNRRLNHGRLGRRASGMGSAAQTERAPLPLRPPRQHMALQSKAANSRSRCAFSRPVVTQASPLPNARHATRQARLRAGSAALRAR